MYRKEILNHEESPGISQNMWAVLTQSRHQTNSLIFSVLLVFFKFINNLIGFFLFQQQLDYKKDEISHYIKHEMINTFLNEN